MTNFTDIIEWIIDLFTADSSSGTDDTIGL